MKKQILFIALALLSRGVCADELVDQLVPLYGKSTVAVLDLAGQQVVCGYTDVNSEINREMYADQVCQHFGFAASVGYRCGMSVGQDESYAKVLTVDPTTGKPIAIPFVKAPHRALGFYSLMICAKEKPDAANALQQALSYRDFALCTHGRKLGSINERKQQLGTAVLILETLSQEAPELLAYEAKRELATLKPIATKLLGQGTNLWDVGTTCPSRSR